MEKLNQYAKSLGANRVGGLITAHHIMYLEERAFDIEVFMPIDKKIPSAENFTFLPYLKIKNGVSENYQGRLCLLPNIYTEIYRKMKSQGIKIKKPFYNVFKATETNIWGLSEKEVEIDIYVVSQFH